MSNEGIRFLTRASDPTRASDANEGIGCPTSEKSSILFIDGFDSRQAGAKT